MAVLELTDFTVFVEGLDHPECVAWGPDGLLYAGGEAGQVYRMTADGGELTEVGSTGGFLLGICLDGDGTVYACDSAKPAVVRMTSTGAVDVYSSGNGDRSFANPNYPVFDRAGNLYVSDSGTFHGDDGCLWVIRPGGATELIDTRLKQFPNGIALNAAEDHLYVALSTLPGVARIPVRDGAVVGAAETVITLDRAIPDGLAFDVDGNLYIACYSPDVIYRVSPDGALDTLAEDWERVTLASPTNLAFGGPDRTTLFVSSLCRWHLAKTELGVAGQPVNYPRLATS
jgi:gluconolactonase